jgi:hypothetical protein
VRDSGFLLIILIHALHLLLNRDTAYMADEERADLMLLKARLELYLQQLNEEIITFDDYGDDDVFAFMITKAKNYRDIIARITFLLNDK